MSDLNVDLVAEGVKGVQENADKLSLQWGLRPGTVSEYNTTTGVASVTYDGDTVPILMLSLIGDVGVGSRVFGIRVPPSGNYIVGFGKSAPLGKTVSRKFFPDSQLVTSAVYIDVLVGGIPATVDFTKNHDWSGIEWQFSAAAFASATGVDVLWALEIDGTDYPTAYGFYNTATQHQGWSATDVITGVDAGTHEVTVRWQNINGTQANMNTQDQISFTLKEVAV